MCKRTLRQVRSIQWKQAREQAKREAALQQELAALKARPAAQAAASPLDKLTLGYLRGWWADLTPAQRKAVDPTGLMGDLVKPWHQRGRIWNQVTRGRSVGKTPYELSPPKKVHHGQGAIQRATV